MDIKKVRNSVEKIFQKYKFVVLILVLGAVLMLIPSTVGNSKKKNRNQCWNCYKQSY